MLLVTLVYILVFFLVIIGLILDIKDGRKKKSLISFIYLAMISFILFFLIIFIFNYKELPHFKPQMAFVGGEYYA